MNLNEDNFAILKASELKKSLGGGGVPLVWVKSLKIDVGSLDRLPNKLLARDDIFWLSKDATFTDLELSLIVLAWGGMRRSNARLALISMDLWLPIVGEMRAGTLKRKAAFRRFHDLRVSGALKGMGAAYYTKLIFFLMSEKNKRGYIMDQWIARSINVLYDTDFIKMNGSGDALHVNDYNNASVYKEFCKILESLAEKLELSPIDAEEKIFSWGGTVKGSWRQYVIDYKINGDLKR